MCVFAYLCVYIYLNYFSVYLKLTQHCKLNILQCKEASQVAQW